MSSLRPVAEREVLYRLEERKSRDSHVNRIDSSMIFRVSPFRLCERSSKAYPGLKSPLFRTPPTDIEADFIYSQRVL